MKKKVVAAVMAGMMVMALGGCSTLLGPQLGEKKAISVFEDTLDAEEIDPEDLIESIEENDYEDVEDGVWAKMDKSESDTGARLFAPSMPGKTLTQQLPYFFDEVLALRLVTDKDGNTGRALMCAPDTMWTAKDRSSRLAAWEPADLDAIFEKIAGGSA